jgi:hypothetical protein
MPFPKLEPNEFCESMLTHDPFMYKFGFQMH